MMLIELPGLLPNEHILSALARWFDGTGKNDFLNTSKRVSRNLSNLNPSVIWRPVYGDLISHYAGTLGFSKVVADHTLVPYYKPFITKKQHSLLKEAITSGAANKIVPSLQNNVAAASVWRWCKLCAVEDYEEYGITYWHTYHQIPSMQRCYRHNATLIHECSQCGFQYKHFQRHWLPPKDGNCLECTAPIEIVNTLDLLITRWLDSISVYLQSHSTQLELENLISNMKQQLGYDALPSSLTVAKRKKVSMIQTGFEQWLSDEVISSYFNRDRNTAFVKGHRLLHIIRTVYRGSSVPPVSLLLMLSYLGLEGELNKLLLE